MPSSILRSTTKSAPESDLVAEAAFLLRDTKLGCKITVLRFGRSGGRNTITAEDDRTANSLVDPPADP